MTPALSPTIFREYDIRGIADTDLCDANVLAIARAFGTYLTRKGGRRVTVAGDVRLSTERIRASVIAGLTDCGLDVIDLGVTTTPLLYWSLFELKPDGGVMITGSHNPKEMNGLKLALGRATLYGEEIQKVGRMALEGDFDLSARKGGTEKKDLWPDYLAMLKSKIVLDRPLHVVTDTANGTAGLGIRQFLTSLGCKVTALYETPDGTFPNHHPDPQKSANMADLAKLVREVHADIGFGFDGDADRIGVVDEKGEIIWGDVLMALIWRELLPKHPGATAIIEVKCSQALEDEVRRLGGVPYYYKAGHSLVKAEMRRIGALFSGEYSGHMFFADEFYGFDDSFYAAGRFLRLLSRTKGPMSALVSDMPKYIGTEEVRIPCSDSEKFEKVKEITDQAVKDHEAVTVDGVRILYGDGWGLIRASNTQPVIALRCEGKDSAALERIKLDLRRRVQAVGLDDFSWTPEPPKK
ncbi:MULTISPECIES: phosphomannomutase/phosphoglucomutase [Jonquetella]|uniref:Phosphomannomutase n=1 Tax=Jonquetella anthropi DSM 22815 TaxID=885272 RepID=H0ULU4_9BACT|nr:MULTISPECIES: phosphomannomutase/phosphoglucomutase [Jonquetella]EHM13585.1 phosphomannomutase [Jonquetella anthropi DSM 22815]ERL24413.1 putative phosphomannomutase/phosphoglucomutase [Jonquetella sp. BV3C21]